MKRSTTMISTKDKPFNHIVHSKAGMQAIGGQSVYSIIAAAIILLGIHFLCWWKFRNIRSRSLMSRLVIGCVYLFLVSYSLFLVSFFIQSEVERNADEEFVGFSSEWSLQPTQIPFSVCVCIPESIFYVWIYSWVHFLCVYLFLVSGQFFHPNWSGLQRFNFLYVYISTVHTI